jgi:prevent-host-death family protein
MPTILPISELRNYTDVLSRVEVNKPVYLTRNGRGTFVISRIDDYDKEATIEELLTEIKKGEVSLVDDERLTLAELLNELDAVL